jgi:hypothetical protein
LIFALNRTARYRARLAMGLKTEFLPSGADSYEQIPPEFR